MNVDLVDARKERNQAQISGLLRFGALVLATPAVLGAVVVGALTGSVLVALVVLILVYGALAYPVAMTLRGFDARFLASLHATPADEQAHARLHNLAEGLGIAHGLPKPALLVLPSSARNICTVPVPGGDANQVAVVVTDNLVEVLSRIELEAILAQQLAHVRNGDTALSMFVAAAASVPAIGTLFAKRAAASLDPHLEQSADLAAVGMTRYPPGLVTALEKLETVSTAVAGATPITAHLWIADPLAVPGAAVGPDPAEPFIPHPPLGDRIAVLREL